MSQTNSASTNTSQSTRRAVVTGASTGIGAATVRLLRQHGWGVVAVARREERLQQLSEETGCEYYAADLSDEAQVAAMAAHILSTGPVDAIVNNAGGALGTERVADAVAEKWRQMYERNVMTALLVTDAFLPQLRERGGDVLFVTSTAAHDTYPGGAGYVAAKHGERIIANTLRQEMLGEQVRVIEIAPGLVKSEEFALNRLGDADKAAAVYAGVAEPLQPEDVAETIVWTLERPSHVNIDLLMIRPVAQASNTLLHRES